MHNSYAEIAEFIRRVFKCKESIFLHEPIFSGNEKKYLLDCIDSTFVSSVGKYVDQFESMISEFTGAKYAIAAVNGTSALHIGLKLVGVTSGDEVITQPLTFIATCNAINYCNATPVFVDVDMDSMGMSPASLFDYLKKNSKQIEGKCINTRSGKRIAAVVPMHTFGLPCRIVEIKEICLEFNVPLVEDAAESLGSYSNGKHTGTFGDLGILSFNGNKIITTGGGGMIITDNPAMAHRAKHLTTTARVTQSHEFVHDEIGYNYRLPNINAALGCAQMEYLPDLIKSKRGLAYEYQNFFLNTSVKAVRELDGCKSNYWLNTIILENGNYRNRFLDELNRLGIMCRPAWSLMSKLPMFINCHSSDLSNAEWLQERIVNLPSGVLLP